MSAASTIKVQFNFTSLLVHSKCVQLKKIKTKKDEQTKQDTLT